MPNGRAMTTRSRVLFPDSLLSKPPLLTFRIKELKEDVEGVQVDQNAPGMSFKRKQYAEMLYGFSQMLELICVGLIKLSEYKNKLLKSDERVH